MAELRIPIVGEFKGKKAFDEAGAATSKLDKGVKKLGAALLAAFSVQKIVAFGKAASKAFIEDEKAATRLAQSVKNLGLAFETPRIEEFISKMANASGVTDDQLRPAMQRLLQTTGSLAKSTEIMNQALDISRGSGIDYETVVNDLSMAYVGQTRGLRKYSLGVTQAELKTMSFAEVQERMTKNFTGANAAYLETYAGKLGILSNAASEASETIGKGLVESLSILAGEGNTVQPLADSMQNLATYTSDVITGLATMIAEFKKLPGVQFYLDEIFPRWMKNTSFGSILEMIRGVAPSTTPGMGGYPSSALGPGYVDPNDAARKKAEAAAAKRARELAALQKKTLDTQKKSLALQKASNTLNLEAIGIEAALKGDISETDRLSLLLQKSILQGNATLATQLSDQLDSAIKRQNELRQSLLTTPKAPNPYEDWKIPADLLNYTAVSLGVSPETVINAPQTIPAQTTDATRELLDALLAAQAAQDKADAAARAAESQSNIFVKVEVDGTEINSSAKTELTNQSLSGSFVNVNRLGRFANTPVAI